MSDYELLRELNDEFGNVVQEKKMKELLEKRNNSILAHGINPVKRLDAEELFYLVRQACSLVIEDLDELMAKALFPRL
jgi:hypothetical protein